MNRFLLVELYEDLEHNDPFHDRFPTTRDGAFLSVSRVNGVKSVTDLAYISQATLDEILLPQSESLVRRPKRTATP